MTNSNVLFAHEFPGTGYPAFTTAWPDFSYPTGNPTGWSQPVVDGHNHGIGSRTLRTSATRPWRAKSDFIASTPNYKVDAEVRWKDPANGEDTVGIIVHFIDYNNCVVARVKCGVTPTLSL